MRAVFVCFTGSFWYTVDDARDDVVEVDADGLVREEACRDVLERVADVERRFLVSTLELLLEVADLTAAITGRGTIGAGVGESSMMSTSGEAEILMTSVAASGIGTSEITAFALLTTPAGFCIASPCTTSLARSLTLFHKLCCLMKSCHSTSDACC